MLFYDPSLILSKTCSNLGHKAAAWLVSALRFFFSKSELDVFSFNVAMFGIRYIPILIDSARVPYSKVGVHM
jgi:hypothetical protein